MLTVINVAFINILQRIINYIPNLIGGILILLIGVVLSSILKRILVALFNFFKIGAILQRLKLMSKQEVRLWTESLAEILRWTVVILFAVPALEVWGLNGATVILNQVLFYLPNVIVAIIIGFFGVIVSNLLSDIVKNGAKNFSDSSANVLAAVTKWILLFFTILAILNQLGVAQDLIRILFSGIMAMIALAGGLAFGLGGKDIAAEILQELRGKLKKK